MVTNTVGGHFELVDHQGRFVTDADYRGRFLLIFFGFTHCRVVCPRALARLSSVLDRLGPLASAIHPLYISVDPIRDTPDVMRAFLESRYPRFTGLTGTPEQIDAAKRAFRVFAQRKADAEDPDGYAVPHTAFAYLLGPEGAYRAHFQDDLEDDVVLGRIVRIIEEEGSPCSR